jgi:YD repeat-containing protein
VQVSGEPISQKPDFSTSGLAENGILQYRPDRYVPFKTPIYDEEGSLLQQQAYRQAKADFDNGLISTEPKKPEPFYQWAYRPEFQFSLYSLLIKEAEALSYVDAALPTIEGAPLTPVEELLDLLYSLDGPDQAALTAYGYDGDRELVFALGAQEVKVTLGADQSVRFDDPSQLAQLDANDLLTLQLYSNNDAGNILYEYQGLPLFESYDHVGLAGTPKPDPKEVETMALSRSYIIGAFENSNAGLSDITDSYKLESFRLDQRSDVSLELLDRDGNSLGYLIRETRLAPGFYHFVVTYNEIISAGISPSSGTDFVLRLTAIEPGSSIKVQQEKMFYGNLRASSEGRMLGQILQHNVLIQDGSLSLQREELKLPGVGPELSFSRSYTNKGSEVGLMGQGWGHNLDITLTKLAFTDDGGLNNLPGWVVSNRGQFFKNHGEGGALTQVSVSNGGLFKWNGTAWEAQRGRHGRLEVVADGIDYFAKDGTRYHFPNSFYNIAEVDYIEDPNGNRLDFTYEDKPHPNSKRHRLLTQVSDQAGRSLNFEYQGQRLVRVSSSEGQSLRFDYDTATQQLVRAYREDATEREELYSYLPDPADGSWNLVSVTDANGHTTQYDYYLPGQTASGLSHYIPGFNDLDLVKSVTYADNAVAEFAYDITTANRRIVTDPRGQTTTYELNFFGNPKRIEEPLGKVTTMAWSIDAGLPDNVMTSRTDAEGRTWSYQYDTNGNVTQETDPANEITRSTWHPQYSLLTERTDRNGHTISNNYDANGNLIKSIDGEGNETIHTYNAKGLRETTLSPRKFLTTYTYDSYGLPESVTGPEGSFTQTQYNSQGLLDNRTDANGNVTHFQYDALGQLTRQTDPDGEITTYDYDPVGNKTDETNRYGLHLEYTYDARNRVTKTTRSGLGIVTADKTYDYDENGNLTEESDWKGVLTTYTYNALNQRITTTDRAGNGLSATYDLVGNKLSDTDQLGQLTEYEYDDLDRLVKTTQKGDGTLNLISRNGYDKEGNLTSTTDAEGRNTTYGYDKRNLKTRRTNALLDDYIWAYDASGNLVSETNEEGALTEYGYDKQERRTSLTRYLDLTTTFTTLYEYDDNGNLTKTSDPRGNRVLTDYDALNRPILITDQDDFQTTIAYSDKGLTSKVTDARSIERTTSKNILEQLILETQGDGGSVSYTYDLNGNLATRTDARGHTTRTEYDQLDRPTQVIEAEGTLVARTTIKTYDLVGNLKTQTDGRGHITAMDYDSLNRLIEITDPAPLSTTQSFTYDDVGNKLTETDRRGNTTSYVYDSLNRLTLVSDPAPLSTSQSFTYDKVGNRLTETDRRSHTTTHSYDALNRLTQSEKPDGQGNTVLLVRNEYDGNDNLTAITDANGNRSVNTYNARNLLTTVTYADTTQTIRTYDQVGNLATETDEASQLTSHTYDNENRLASTTNPDGETESYGYDFNGNRTSLTRPLSNGWSYQYDPLNRLSQVSNSLSHTTSYEYDADGNQTAHVDAEGKRVEYQYDALSSVWR